MNPATKPWTTAQLRLLQDVYPRRRRAEVEAFFPGRTWNAIRLQARQLRIRRVRLNELVPRQLHPLVEQLRARRVALGLRQLDVAERAGVAVQTVVDLERGNGQPWMPTVIAVAGALGLRLALEETG